MRFEFSGNLLALLALAVLAVGFGLFAFMMLRRASIALRGRRAVRLQRHFAARFAVLSTRPGAAGLRRDLRRPRHDVLTALTVAAQQAGLEDGRLRGQLCEAGVPTLLVRALRPHRDHWPRAAAARAIGLLGFTECESHLAALLDDPNLNVAYAGAQALAALGTAGAAAHLLRRVTGTARLNNARLVALAERMPCPLRPLLAQLLAAPDAASAFWALHLIAARREFELLEAVRPFLASADASVRTAAVKCLARLAVPLSDRWLEPLLADADWVVRCQAAKALGEMRSGWAAEPLARLLADSAWWCRHNALEALVRLGPTALPPLEEVLERSPDKFARNCAVEALERLGWFEQAARAATRGGARAVFMLELAARNGGAGYLENALLTADADDLPVVLELLARVGDSVTAGRIGFALPRRQLPPGQAARAREIAAALRVVRG